MFTWQEIAVLVLVIVGIPLGILGIAIYLLTGGLQRFALRPLQRCYGGIELHETLKPGDVQFAYHTYRGLILWTTMNEHRIIAPAADAEKLLRRFLWFNLTWGMLGYCTILIPFLAIGNYLAQRRSIRNQLAAMEHVKGELGKTE